MKNKFVESCQHNSKEVQEALIALGYEWSENDGKVRHLDAQLVFTDENGRLTHYFNNKGSVPCLYDFTEETKLVATLKPVNNEFVELHKQADALTAKIKEMEAKQC